MSISRKIVAVVACSILLPSAGGGYLLFTWKSDQLAATIQKIGFVPLNPPNTLRGPGAVYRISRFGRETQIVCSVDRTRVERVWQKSATASWQFSELSNIHFGLDAILSDMGKTGSDSDARKNVSFTLEAVTVYEVPLSDLADILTDLEKQSPSCGQVIKTYLDAGDFICQGQQVLQATARYAIRTDEKTKGSVQAEVKKANDVINIKVDPEASRLSDSETIGTQLYYGMRLTPYCIAPKGQPPRKLPVTWYEWLLYSAGLFH